MKRVLVILLVSGVYTLSAGQGNADSVRDALNACKRGDCAEFLDKIWCWAAAGDSESQFNVGLVYQNGDGVPRSYKKAVIWWRKAAQQGDRRA